jgi:hypothetical protein
MLLNFNAKPRKVTIEFEDGSVETYEIGVSCGFLREGYTYAQDENDKVIGVLHTYELYWTERKESTDAINARPS